MSTTSPIAPDGTDSDLSGAEPKDHATSVADIPMEVLQEAVNREMRIHKALGNPIVGMEDGKIVWTQPEDIVIDD